MPRRLLMALMLLSLSACVPYPVYRTTQPEAELQVLDESGLPLAGASVTLIGHAHPDTRRAIARNPPDRCRRHRPLCQPA